MHPPLKITPEAVAIFRRLYPGKNTHVEVNPVQNAGGWAVPLPPKIVTNPDLEYIQQQLDEGFQLTAADVWEFMGVPRDKPVQQVVYVAAAPSPSETAATAPVIPAPVPSVKNRGMMLSEAGKLYIDHCTAPEDTMHYKALKPGTISGKQQALLRLTEWQGGDVPIDSLLDIEYKSFTRFLMSDCDLGKVSAKCRLKDSITFFKFLKEFNYTDRVPTITYPKLIGAEKLKTANLPFSYDELSRFINYIMTNRHSQRRVRKTQIELVYLILMFIYSGFRKEEQMSFTRAKIKKVKDIYYFDFTEMSKDNVASIRMVPVHSRLRSLGFLEFAEIHKGAIFPRDDSGYRRMFVDILTELGIYTGPNSKTFHGCRSTFDSFLAGEIEDSTRKTLMGHTQVGMDKTYLHQMVDKMPMYAKAVEKLKYELPFEELKVFLRREVADLYR